MDCHAFDSLIMTAKPLGVGDGRKPFSLPEKKASKAFSYQKWSMVFQLQLRRVGKFEINPFGE